MRAVSEKRKRVGWLMAGLLWGLSLPAAAERVEIVGADERSRQALVWQPQAGGAAESLVVLSHGLGGRAEHMAATAEAIAAAGHLVVSVQHGSDHLFGTREHMYAMESRADDILAARAWALREYPVAPARTGVLGYSQGGLSAMIAAGVRPQRDLARQHCQHNAAEDRGFCGYASFWMRLARDLGLTRLFSGFSGDFSDDRPAADFAALAVVAPVAVFVPGEQIAAQPAEIAIYSFGRDRVLAPAYHADHLHRALGARAHRYRAYPQEGHGGLFGARAAEINADIAAFFSEKL